MDLHCTAVSHIDQLEAGHCYDHVRRAGYMIPPPISDCAVLSRLLQMVMQEAVPRTAQ